MKLQLRPLHLLYVCIPRRPEISRFASSRYVCVYIYTPEQDKHSSSFSSYRSTLNLDNFLIWYNLATVQYIYIYIYKRVTAIGIRTFVPNSFQDEKFRVGSRNSVETRANLLIHTREHLRLGPREIQSGIHPEETRHAATMLRVLLPGIIQPGKSDRRLVSRSQTHSNEAG